MNEKSQDQIKINKPRLKESKDVKDLVKMQAEVALAESMLRSKTLTIMVVVGITIFAGFGYFLVKMAA